MKKIHPTKYTDKQWKRKYQEYIQLCRKSPWKIDDENIAEFEEFKQNISVDIYRDIRMSNIPSQTGHTCLYRPIFSRTE